MSLCLCNVGSYSFIFILSQIHSDDQLKEYDSNVKGAVLISQFLSEHPVVSSIDIYP